MKAMLATLDLLILRLSSKKFPDLWLIAAIPQLLGIPSGQERLAFGVEKDRIIGNCKNAGKLVSDDQKGILYFNFAFKLFLKILSNN